MRVPWAVPIGCLLILVVLCAGAPAQPCAAGGAGPVVVPAGDTTMWWTNCYPTAPAPRGRCRAIASDPSRSAALLGSGCGARMTGWTLASPLQQETMRRCSASYHLLADGCPHGGRGAHMGCARCGAAQAGCARRACGR